MRVRAWTLGVASVGLDVGDGKTVQGIQSGDGRDARAARLR